MSCYDSVIFTCPDCGVHFEQQSKSGDRDLDNFWAKSVPVKVISGLPRTIHCPKCSKSYTIVSDLPATASLTLVPEEEE